MARRTHATTMPRTAMILAAGKGLRMRPLTVDRPKPLVELAGKALIDHALDALEDAEVQRAIVNIHHLGEQLIAHLRGWSYPQIVISDERDGLLGTGGGIARALPLIGRRPFYLLNCDSVWRDGRGSALYRLADTFDAEAMDALLLLVPPERGVGYAGMGDFVRGADGRLRRRGETDRDALVYMGVGLIHPRLFAGAPRGAFSLNLLFDRAIAEGRLFGLVHEGEWMHVGSPAALEQAEERLAAGRA